MTDEVEEQQGVVTPPAAPTPLRNRIRHRSLPRPNLTDRLPRLEHAGLDKITVQFRWPFYAHSPEDVGNWFHSMVESDRLTGNPQALKLGVVGAERTWLFGAEIYAARSRTVPGQNTLKLTLNLNLTRFLANNHAYLPHLEQQTPYELLRVKPELNAAAVRLTLDGGDNFIGDYTTMPAIDRERVLRLYIRVVLQFLMDQMLRFPGLGIAGVNLTELHNASVEVPPERITAHSQPSTPLPIILHPNAGIWSLPHVEIYWDCHHTDTVSSLERIYECICAAVPRVNAREYDPVTPAQASWDRNCPSYEIPLGRQHLFLGIYAKTAEVIRFEVRYKRNARQRLGRRSSGRDVPFTYDGLIMALHTTLPQNAYERADPFFQEISQHLQDGEEGITLASLSGFLTAIGAACGGQPELTSQVTQLLLIRGGITEIENPLMRAVISELVSKRILGRARFLRRSDIAFYSVTTAYRHMLTALAGIIPRLRPRHFP